MPPNQPDHPVPPVTNPPTADSAITPEKISVLEWQSSNEQLQQIVDRNINGVRFTIRTSLSQRLNSRFFRSTVNKSDFMSDDVTIQIPSGISFNEIQREVLLPLVDHGIHHSESSIRRLLEGVVSDISTGNLAPPRAETEQPPPQPPEKAKSPAVAREEHDRPGDKAPKGFWPKIWWGTKKTAKWSWGWGSWVLDKFNTAKWSWGWGSWVLDKFNADSSNFIFPRIGSKIMNFLFGPKEGGSGDHGSPLAH